MSVDLADELTRILGEDRFVELVEQFGGTRLYVPGEVDRSGLVEIIGIGPALKLCAEFPGAYIRVPLARELRALRYRRAGMSNREIALKLGITETGVDKLIKRAKGRNLPGARLTRQAGDDRQMGLFEEASPPKRA